MFEPQAEWTSDGRGSPGDTVDFKAFGAMPLFSRLEVLSVSKDAAAAHGVFYLYTHTYIHPPPHTHTHSHTETHTGRGGQSVKFFEKPKRAR